MSLLIVSVFVLFSYVGTSPTFKALEDSRIVGGYDVDIKEAPYQVSLMSRRRHVCGGSIIANDLILTAAHCVIGSYPSDFKIRAGSSSINNGGVVVAVREVIAHPDFSIAKMDNDVALLQLAKPLVFNAEIQPITLMDDGLELDAGSEMIVTGWGNLREGGGSPETLQMVSLPSVSGEVCNTAYQPYYEITPRMLCAGLNEGGKDACQGDSGGPLVYEEKLAGVVSWGIGCARPTYPGVYAKVSALRSWIDRNAIYLRAKTILRTVLQ